jgi:hypothetical protein
VEKLVACRDTITKQSEVEQCSERCYNKCYPGERIPGRFDDPDEVHQGAHPHKNVGCANQVLSKSSAETAAFVFPAKNPFFEAHLL